MLVHLPKLKRDDAAGRSHFKKKFVMVGVIAILATGLFFMSGARNVFFRFTQSPVGSWNPAVSCNPSVFTIEQIAGAVANPNQRLPNRGADYSGGALLLSGKAPAGVAPSSSSWPFSKRSIHIPCSEVTPGGATLPTFVEIHNVKVNSISNDECGSVFPGVCDETFNICDSVAAPTCASTYPSTMDKIHSEIDMNWIHSNIAPKVPTPGTLIDIQGYVFWDDAHLNASWHSFSGWEIHPVTAWRLAVHASPSMPPSVTYDSILAVNSENRRAPMFTTVLGFSPIFPTNLSNNVVASVLKSLVLFSSG